MILNTIVAFLLTFILPGYTLVNAVFPSKGELDDDFDLIYRITFGIGMSVVITILVGFSLGIAPLINLGTGYFDYLNVLITLSSLTLIFFVIGWWRGAYRWMGIIHPKLERPELEVLYFEEDDRELIEEIEDLFRKKQILKKEIKKAQIKIDNSSGSMKEHYRDILEERKRELEKVDKKLRELEKQREDELY